MNDKHNHDTGISISARASEPIAGIRISAIILLSGLLLCDLHQYQPHISVMEYTAGYTVYKEGWIHGKVSEKAG